MPMRCNDPPSSGAFPVRSPLPREVPLITAQPARTAARQLATINHVSVVRVEFQIFRDQAHGTKRRKNPRHTAWQGDILVWESQAHCVASAEFGRGATW